MSFAFDFSGDDIGSELQNPDNAVTASEDNTSLPEHIQQDSSSENPRILDLDELVRQCPRAHSDH